MSGLTRLEAELVALFILADGSPICPLLTIDPLRAEVYVGRLRAKGVPIPTHPPGGHARGGQVGYRLAALPPDEHLGDALAVLDEWRGDGMLGAPTARLCLHGLHAMTPDNVLNPTTWPGTNGHRCRACFEAWEKRRLERLRRRRAA